MVRASSALLSAAAVAEAAVAASSDQAFLTPAGAQGALAGRKAALRPDEARSGLSEAPRSGHSVCLGALATAIGAGAALAARRRNRAAEAGFGARTAVRAFESELGVQPPFGFWDPLGFCKDGDVEDFKRRRETELKHGRVAMYAAMGYITPEYYKFPGYLAPSSELKFEDVPNGLAAIAKVPVEGWLQWVALCGFYELVVNQPSSAMEPGNYGRGQLGFTGQSISDAAKRTRSLNSEIANGRLAMMAITGMFFQDGLTGSAWGDWSLYEASPLRAQPKVLEGTGGPFPESFWDPAGLAKGKSDEQLLRWRAVELKNGRVAMLACLGWFHVAAGWHPIGDMAARGRVSNDPLVNATELPIGGAFQVVFTIMCLEWLTTYVCKPPAEKPWDILGWSSVIADEEAEDWKNSQLQELNNGRLAMVAIVGLVAQDMVTGEYFAEIAKPCFGNVVCADAASWTNVFPSTPFVMPPLYPQA